MLGLTSTVSIHTQFTSLLEIALQEKMEFLYVLISRQGEQFNLDHPEHIHTKIIISQAWRGLSTLGPKFLCTICFVFSMNVKKGNWYTCGREEGINSIHTCTCMNTHTNTLADHSKRLTCNLARGLNPTSVLGTIAWFSSRFRSGEG